MESRELDIVIVGEGPAGLSTWLHLHSENPRLAARTLLIEKAVYPRDKLCGGGIVPQADEVLRDLGVDLRVPSVLIQHVDYVFGPSRLRWNHPHAFRVVRRYEFDHALARAAVERGLTLNVGEAFRRFERSGQSLVVETTRGRYRVLALIGADGASSLVRRAMNLRERPRMSRLLEVVMPAPRRNLLDFTRDTAVFDFSPVAQGLQGYVWYFPCLVAGVPSFNRGIFDSRVYPDSVPAKLNKVFAEALKGQASFSEPSTWSAHPERWFDPQGMYAQPNVLLVGDAAGVEATFGEGSPTRCGTARSRLSTLFSPSSVLTSRSRTNVIAYSPRPRAWRSSSRRSRQDKCMRMLRTPWSNSTDVSPRSWARSLLCNDRSPGSICRGEVLRTCAGKSP